jgi:hypothetical protein
LSLLATLVCTQSVLAQAAASDDRSSSVVGYVSGRLEGDVHVLPFAMVEGLAGAVRKRALTDAQGRYVMTGLPPGEITLSVTHAGYQPMTLVVTARPDGVVAVDMQLRARPVPLDPLDVRADSRGRGRAPDAAETEASLAELEMQALEVGPGLGQAGIADVLAALPGNDPGDATDVLFMRGTTTDMKLVLLDGVPVYTPFHVAGLMKSFEPAVIDRAELHVGGAPARFDGGLSQILELTTRRARRDAVHFSGSVDLLSGSGAVEVPLGARAGVVASARTLHDIASAPLGRDRPYGYSDALVSADFEPADGHELRATGFWNDESVTLDLEPASNDARWSNRAGSAAYRSDLGGATLEITGGASQYDASLPIQPGADPDGSLPPAVLATAETNRARVVGELLWGSASAPVRTGLSFERITAAFSGTVVDGSEGVGSRGSISTMGAFVDATRPLAPGVSVRAGLRVDHFLGKATRLAPRASIRWAVGREALLTLTAGRYHQPTRTPEVDVDRTLAQVAEGAVPAELLPIATADHVVMSLDQKLNGSVRLGLQGFWKSFDGLPGLDGSQVRNSGVDVRVLTGSDRATAWLGYGLSWFWSHTDVAGRATNFTGHHLLSAGVAGSVGGPLRGELRVAYGAGLPYTSIPLGGLLDVSASTPAVTSQSEQTVRDQTTFGPLASGDDPSFLRVDAELYALLHPTWGGREWRVRPYLRLLNALDRRDALFYAFEPWRSDAVRPLAELPILPLAGVAVSF